MKPVVVTEGSSPVILAFPHGGTNVPDQIKEKLSENGQLLQDTDWHIHQLYDGLLENATYVQATFHRYVVDANRDPEGISLYPGQNTTTLCPLTDFDGNDIWKEGQAPTEADIIARRDAFHTPYHTALAAEIERVHAKYGFTVLYDCHSIRSNIPFLFDGKLPDFNIGTNSGTSCASKFEKAVETVCADATDFTHIVNGRFKGGWTTRNYADLDRNIHAIQMELGLGCYCNEDHPWNYEPQVAEKLRPVLKDILQQLENAALTKR
jgi:N-formylglutamate deformylase